MSVAEKSSLFSRFLGHVLCSGREEVGSNPGQMNDVALFLLHFDLFASLSRHHIVTSTSHLSRHLLRV